MYTGAIAVPLVVGGALNLPKNQIAFLINADLFACGIVTPIQTIGIWKFGIRLPIMMGITFASVAPMIAIGNNVGLVGIYESVIAYGIIGILIAPVIGKMLRFFPPVVTGTVITKIGISIIGIGMNWAAGGKGNPDYGNPLYIGIALSVLVFIRLITKFCKGFLVNIAVLLGILFGFLFSLCISHFSFDGLSEASWVGFISPFHFCTPTFDFWSIITMTMVMLVTFIESSGMFLAVGDT